MYAPLTWQQKKLILSHRSQVLAQFSASMSMMSTYGLEERDFDDVKYLFSESSLFMLALTNVISILHLMFDYLVRHLKQSTYLPNLNLKCEMKAKNVYTRPLTLISRLLSLHVLVNDD